MDDKKLLEIFGFNIKIERLKKKLSQEELAYQLNFSTVYISNVELGKHNLSLINANKFCNYFNKPIEYFLKENL